MGNIITASRLVTLDEIRAAAERIRGVARVTPLLEVTAAAGRPLFLKCENLQPAGAFKIRGAYNMVARLHDEVRPAGVITYSSGNHGLAMALAAERLGMPAIVVMPEDAPEIKIDGVRRHGAEVIFAGTTSVERKTRAEAESAVRGYTIVPPFDHPWIIAGAGTCGLEIIEQCPNVSAVYSPVGGGGLVSGIAAAVKRCRPSVRVIGVEPAGAAKMSASRAAGRAITLERTSTIADGLRPLRPGDLTFAHVQALVDDVVTVSDEAIAAAVRWLYRETGVIAEPSGATSVAAALEAVAAPAGTVAVVSGGNVAPGDFARYISEPEGSDLRPIIRS
jgi:threonine dehydratase